MTEAGQGTDWELFKGDGEVHRSAAAPGKKAWIRLPPLRSWREHVPGTAPKFDMPAGLATAVNAALHLRRPLLLTGGPGSGKSTLVELIAAELELGQVLRWHITSRSTLAEGLYEYDALGRLHATQAGEPDAVENFVTLGPLGTALAADQARAVLVDEIDKSDLDLPGDLLDVMERGEFPIPPLVRAADGPLEARGADDPFHVRGADGAGPYDVGRDGRVRLQHFPVIVFTSNGERSFSAPFLRRCVRFEMPPLDEDRLVNIVTMQLDAAKAATERAEIVAFAERAKKNPLAINQILEFVALVTEDHPALPGGYRDLLKQILLQELND